MKAYIKPKAEIMEYSFDETIAGGSVEFATEKDEVFIPDQNEDF